MIRLISISALLLAIVLFDGVTQAALANSGNTTIILQTVRTMTTREKHALALARQTLARRAYARQKLADAGAATQNENQEQEAAREAYRRGEIKSLSVIRRTVITSYKGRIISTRFQQVYDGRTRYYYNFRVLSSNGEMMQVRVNARNARIIKVTGER